MKLINRSVFCGLLFTLLSVKILLGNTVCRSNCAGALAIGVKPLMPKFSAKLVTKNSTETETFTASLNSKEKEILHKYKAYKLGSLISHNSIIEHTLVCVFFLLLCS